MKNHVEAEPRRESRIKAGETPRANLAGVVVIRAGGEEPTKGVPEV